ncbi:MAG: phosphoglycerate dehydrogenase, partial [Fimbriimonadaceae bacterium]|nr:phosphoglycerate dehydrogenase [Chitinophagales bacterium]
LAQYLKTNDTIGYVVLDVDAKMSKNAFDVMKNVKGTIKTRLLY